MRKLYWSHTGGNPLVTAAEKTETMCSLKWRGKKHSILIVLRVHIRFTEVKPLIYGNFPFHAVGVCLHIQGCAPSPSVPKRNVGPRTIPRTARIPSLGDLLPGDVTRPYAPQTMRRRYTHIHVTGYMCVRKSKGEALLEVNHCVFLASDGGRRQLQDVFLRLGGQGRGVWEGAKWRGVNLCGEARRTDRAMNICSGRSRLCVGTMSHSEDTLCQSLDNHEELPQFSLVV